MAKPTKEFTDDDCNDEDMCLSALARIYSRDELILLIGEDVKAGMLIGDMQIKHKLSWNQIRPILELVGSPAVKAAQKLRMAAIASDSAEKTLQSFHDKAHLMDVEKMPAAIKTMVDVANQLSGGPSQVIEVRHSAVAPDAHNDELVKLREHHKRIASGEVVDVESEVMEIASTNVDDY